MGTQGIIEGLQADSARERRQNVVVGYEIVVQRNLSPQFWFQFSMQCAFYVALAVVRFVPPRRFRRLVGHHYKLKSQAREAETRACMVR